MKVRTIITQDAEVDDQNSLRHFLLYANEVNLLGIVQTSSKFHWRGVPGTKVTRIQLPGELQGDPEEGSFDKPYRWTGTDWMFRTIDDYEKDYPNLCRHSQGYPTPAYLRSITKIGNVGYKGELEGATEGSELICKAILEECPDPLYIQVWGGCNTIVQALMDIEAEYGKSAQWPALHEKLTKRIIITACGEQDETYRLYIAERWPGIQFVKTLQMGSYAYGWFRMPEGESKDTLRAPFMKQEILNGKSALAKGYCTWLDGVEYEGEPPMSQFGANPNIATEWFGARFGLGAGEQYDFLSEGDSPTFFPLLDWGFRTLEDFSYGGIAGRYHPVTNERNTKGELLNVWDVSLDSYTDRQGNTQPTESMWPYVADIQRDFAARVDWAGTSDFHKAEHQPGIRLVQGNDFTAAPGQTLHLTAQAFSPDKAGVTVTFRIYEEASAQWAKKAKLDVNGAEANITIPQEAVAGDALHIIVKAQADGHHRLTHYQQAIIRIC